MRSKSLQYNLYIYIGNNLIITGILDEMLGFCWKVVDIDVLWTGVIVISLRDC